MVYPEAIDTELFLPNKPQARTRAHLSETVAMNEEMRIVAQMTLYV